MKYEDSSGFYGDAHRSGSDGSVFLRGASWIFELPRVAIYPFCLSAPQSSVPGSSETTFALTMVPEFEAKKV